MRYKAGYKRPRAKNVKQQDQEEPLVVLQVDMVQYYEWLAKRLDAKTIEKIKKINSREGFEAYMRDMKIEFVFETHDRNQMELEV